MRKIIVLLLILLSACANFIPAKPILTPINSGSLEVRIHPEGKLYVGDQVSFEVIGSDPSLDGSTSVRISLGDKTLGEEVFGSFGMGGRNQASFFWVFDSSNLQSGDVLLTFSLPARGIHWTESITLLPANEMPSPEKGAGWKSVETTCCIIHYVSGTEAERDLEKIKEMADTQAADVERRMGAKLDQKIPLTYFPRTVGHGGFTSAGIYVSYLDMNYAGSTATQVTHHEMVHWLDSQIGGSLRPSIFQEGLAVYLSDGHFKVEPILPRAAALIDLGWYVPLRKLTDNFYTSQHEVGYAEAAALIDYMVSTYGWQDFNQFYRNIAYIPGGKESAAMEAALRGHYRLTLDELEANFLTYLKKQNVDENNRRDMQLSAAYYNTVRRYQAELDPAAYFLYAWLPDVKLMQQRNIVADFMRHPDSLLNRVIENMLVTANKEFLSGDLSAVEAIIRSINVMLDGKQMIGKFR